MFQMTKLLSTRPYNLLISMDEIFLVPRRQERADGFSGAFASLEMAGCVILTDSHRYEGLTHGEVTAGIAACGVDQNWGYQFKHRLREFYSWRSAWPRRAPE
jgi:ATP adenylyltransferase/5',5'''-P-1,P-4-tetraphosphate phosphorylase II